MKMDLHAILCHTLGPYHTARYAALARLRDDFVVIELASEQSSHSWKSDKANLPFQVISLHEGVLQEIPPGVYSRELMKVLDRMRPASVVSLSYYEPYMRAAAIWARKHGAASIMMNDSWEGDKRRNIALETMKSAWCRWAYDGAMVAGIRTAQYVQKLGIPERRIWRGLDIVDNAYFAVGAKAARDHHVELREALNLPEKYFLGIFRLIPQKNIPRLLLAYQTYLRHGGDWDLVMVGGGAEEAQIRRLSGEVAGSKIHVLNWKSYEELPAYYGLASGFILPSISESWGLVVNEAMASELPVLVSTKCGCQPELCLRGINGFDFDPYSVNDMATSMIKLSSLNSGSLWKMGAASEAIIHNYSPDTMALSLSDCLDTVKCRRSAFKR